MNHLRKGRFPMNRKQFVLTLSVAVISAFLGGIFGVWFLMPPSVLAQDEPQKVIRAEEFQVVDEDSRIRMMIQSDGITLYDVQGEPKTFWRSNNGYSFLGFPSDNGQLQVGMAPEGPMITMRDSHDADGLSLTLFRNKPNLTLYESGDERAILGTTDLKNNRTGSTEIRAPASLVLFDEEGNVVWSAP